MAARTAGVLPCATLREAIGVSWSPPIVERLKPRLRGKFGPSSLVSDAVMPGMIPHAVSGARATFLCSMCTLSVWPQPEAVRKASYL